MGATTVSISTRDSIDKQYFPKMKDEIDHILVLRKCQGVRRFHTWPIIREQRIDEHSYGAALIAMYLDPQLNGDILKAVLFHDLAEWFTGDTPGPAKRMSQELKNGLTKLEEACEEYLGTNIPLDDYGKLIVKLADNLEGLMYCFEERMLGNRNIDQAFKNYLLFIRDTASGVNNAAVERAVALAKVMMYKYEYEAGGICGVSSDIF